MVEYRILINENNEERWRKAYSKWRASPARKPDLSAIADLIEEGAPIPQKHSKKIADAIRGIGRKAGERSHEHNENMRWRKGNSMLVKDWVKAKSKDFSRGKVQLDELHPALHDFVRGEPSASPDSATCDYMQTEFSEELKRRGIYVTTATVASDTKGSQRSKRKNSPTE